MLLELAIFFEVSSFLVVFFTIWLYFFQSAPKIKANIFLQEIENLIFSVFIVLNRGGAGYFTFMI